MILGLMLMILGVIAITFVYPPDDRTTIILPAVAIITCILVHYSAFPIWMLVVPVGVIVWQVLGGVAYE
jgi:hypothetical protein